MKLFLAAILRAAAAARRKPRTTPEPPVPPPDSASQRAEAVRPEWCIVANLLPYPYNPGPKEHYRSHRIFPAGAKLHVVGGFAGMGNEVVCVVGTNHHGRIVIANIAARLLGGWRVALIHRPAVLRAIHRSANHKGAPAHRWHNPEWAFDSPEYADKLREQAAGFQQWLHGGH
ncbi:hypothetical protein ACWIGI_11285 [Nocardia sp. NPDC055321]